MINAIFLLKLSNLATIVNNIKIALIVHRQLHVFGTNNSKIVLNFTRISFKSLNTMRLTKNTVPIFSLVLYPIIITNKVSVQVSLEYVVRIFLR